MHKRTGSLRIGMILALACLAAQPALAQRMSGEEIISALENGGYVIVMRHAASSLDAARATGRGGGFGFGGGGGRGGRGDAPPPEPTEEALEQQSKDMLTGMRYAIWHFQIPIGAVYSSPTRPTREHAEELPFADITIVDDLDRDRSGSGWLAAKLRETPMAGTNSIIVTHSANIEADLGMNNVAEGDSLIVRPGANPEVVGRLGLREWSVLATEDGG